MLQKISEKILNGGIDRSTHLTMIQNKTIVFIIIILFSRCSTSKNAKFDSLDCYTSSSSTENIKLYQDGTYKHFIPLGEIDNSFKGQWTHSSNSPYELESAIKEKDTLLFKKSDVDSFELEIIDYYDNHAFYHIEFYLTNEERFGFDLKEGIYRYGKNNFSTIKRVQLFKDGQLQIDSNVNLEWNRYTFILNEEDGYYPYPLSMQYMLKGNTLIRLLDKTKFVCKEKDGLLQN